MPMIRVRDYSIRKKLTWLNMLVSGAALLVACAAFGFYAFTSFKDSMVRDLSIQAQIVGTNSVSALLFDDATAAHNTLTALKGAPNVVAAGIYSTHGEPLAVYWRNGAERILPAPPIPNGETETHTFTKQELLLTRLIVFRGKPTGIVHLRSDLEGLTVGMWRYAGIVGVVLSLSLIAALLLSSVFQRALTRPILQLAETARIVSRDREFSVRVPTPGNHDEIAVLIDAFNDMLVQIQQRDLALQAQLERLHLLDQITRAITERQDVASVFQVVIRTLEDSLPVDFACVCLYDKAAETLNVICVGARSEALATELAMTEQARFEVDQNGLGRCVGGQLVYEPDVSKSVYPFPQRLSRNGLRSVVLSPLISENNVFGVLVVARRQAESFSSGDCEFLRQLSGHVSLAAGQTRIFMSLQQAYDDLRQTQQSVMQQERLRGLGKMASGIAQDINNALSPVALYTESLLESEPNLSSRTRLSLETIQRAVDDVAQTVGRMREFYRPRELQLALLPVEVNLLIQQVLELTRARWRDMPQQRGIMIQMKTDLVKDPPVIVGVESEIREALTNLVFNAVDAMPDGGILTLRTKTVIGETAGGKAAQRVHIEVEDSGVGMDEATRRHCLEPFFTTKGERGTGLGLAMVYGMVQRQNAEIEIISAIGKGTIARLDFPVPEAAPDTQEPEVHAPSNQSLNILVIDDDPVLIRSLRETLERDGHSVVTADGGNAGIEAFRKGFAGKSPFSLVITDLGMPYTDGRKVANAIKAISPSTPVVLLTGWGQRLIDEGDTPPNVDKVLSKPPKLRELRSAVAMCVDRQAEALAGRNHYTTKIGELSVE